MYMYYKKYKLDGVNLSMGYNTSTWSIMKSLTLNTVEPLWIEESNVILNFRRLLRDKRFARQYHLK